MLLHTQVIQRAKLKMFILLFIKTQSNVLLQLLSLSFFLRSFTQSPKVVDSPQIFSYNQFINFVFQRLTFDSEGRTQNFQISETI